MHPDHCYRLVGLLTKGGALVSHLDAQFEVKHVQIHTFLGRSSTMALYSIIIGAF